MRPVRTNQTSVVASVEAQPLAQSVTCTGHFVTHRLDFSTGTRLREITTYISNGSGVAVNDLDGDGDLDLVFASIDGANAILWNQGGLEFTSEDIDDRFSRAATIVDVDGDGLLDITFTHRGLEPPSFWRNHGSSSAGARFVRTPLPGVDHFAYAMAWGDLNSDGRLDLVTGSYAAELKQHAIADPSQESRAGLVIYLQQDDGFVAQVLDRTAEVLSIGLPDLNGDGQPEIWVSNDFAVRDQVWQRTAEQWQLVEPFATTSHSTMSLEWADIANNGELALFTTDMNPYDTSPHTLAEWLPMMARMGEHRASGDPQIMANVLQVQSGQSAWRNDAVRRGLDATGWSWAARFGDLDNDGWLDLYVVNGMIAADMFGHLPNGELVEENQAFRNNGEGAFALAPQWGLGSTASGRGMVMADLDGDGDLDIVVNNLRSFAQLFENQLCGGSGLEVDLAWPAVENSHAIGAQLRLHTNQGVLERDLRASGSYLSGDATRIHFGVPAGAHLQSLDIIWPDGALSTVKPIAAGAHVVVTR